MNTTFKRHLISAGQTFVAGFALVTIPDLIDLTHPISLSGAALVAVFIAGFRAGVKLAWELVVYPMIQAFLQNFSA